MLQRLGESRLLRDGPLPFAIVAGASAGAINGALIAAHSASFREATHLLARLWGQLQGRAGHSHRCDVAGAHRARHAPGHARRRTPGAHRHAVALRRPATACADRTQLPRRGHRGRHRAGHLYAVAISATSYHSGRSFTFVQGRRGHPIWVKSRRVVLPVELTAAHVSASCAIPIVFPPVRVPSVAGDLYFGDGGLRLVTPFSPAIRLGATHVFAIGVRSQRAADALSREELSAAEESGTQGAAILRPPLAQICGVFLNAIFLDHLDSDLDHLRRMNELIAAHRRDDESGRQTSVPVTEPMRQVTPLAVSPS